MGWKSERAREVTEMKVYFDRPGKIDGFWSWVYDRWQIHTPASYLRYETERGVRYFGLTFELIERDKYGTVL